MSEDTVIGSNNFFMQHAHVAHNCTVGNHMVLAGGAALMAVVGILFFKEAAAWPRLLGIALSISGLILLKR